MATFLTTVGVLITVAFVISDLLHGSLMNRLGIGAHKRPDSYAFTGGLICIVVVIATIVLQCLRMIV